MPLYDVTTRDYLVDPEDAENYDVLQHAMSVINTQRFAKDVRIIDQALQASVKAANKNNKLVFTKAGILVGHASVTPHADVNHVWESAEIAYPTLLPGMKSKDREHAGEMQLKFIGGMTRWRISVRPETWLAYRRDSGKFNQFTGKEIKVSEYWVNEDYVFTPAPKRSGFTTDDLKAKFNSR